jgi:hypothetical protein
MDVVELAKLKDYIENSIILTKDTENSKIANMLLPILSEVKSKVQVKLDEINIAAESLKQRRIRLPGPNRLQFFKSHDYNPAEVEFFNNILSGFSGWNYPGLVLFPGVGHVLNSMVSSEPLYIADTCDEVLQHCAGTFNEHYSTKRLMQYRISKYDLSPLPQEAFGLVTSVNWTVFESLDGLSEIADSVYELLLPGGIYLFNYNPLDKYWGVEQNTKQLGYGALTEDLIENLISIGFEIEKVNKQPHKMAYVICKKAGTLDSPKLTSILAKIIATDEELL